MRFRKSSKLVIILLAAIAVAATYLYLSYRKETLWREVDHEKLYTSLGITRIDPPEKAQDFTLKNLEGNEVTLQDYRGKVVFLNFWATWCGPCRMEMPSMEKLWQEFKEEEFVILAIDIRERPEKVMSFVIEESLSFPVLLDETGQLAGAYGIRGIPTTFFLNPEGEIVGKAVGARDWAVENSFELVRELLLEVR